MEISEWGRISFLIGRKVRHFGFCDWFDGVWDDQIGRDGSTHCESVQIMKDFRALMRRSGSEQRQGDNQARFEVAKGCSV